MGDSEVVKQTVIVLTWNDWSDDDTIMLKTTEWGMLVQNAGLQYGVEHVVTRKVAGYL